MTNNNSILIVDDTIENLDILVDLLSSYDVIGAISGKDALEILNDEKIDLILLDIMMPDMDGFEVCEILKENKNTKDIPVIFITAKTDEDSIDKAFEVGGVDYLTKPFRPRELLSRIKTQLNLINLKNAEMEHSKQLGMSSLISNIAHQWRQPLSVISTSATAISLEYELGILKDNDFNTYCEAIVKQTEYLSSVIDNFASIVNNPKEKTIFNLKNLINKNYNLFFNDLEFYNTNLVLRVDDNIEISSYYHTFTQVLLLIINNAKDFVKINKLDKKLIFLEASKQNNKLELNIFDNGLGIENDIIKHVFEPYFTTKHKSLGKGLSLYIVYKLITEVLDGTIDISNKTYKYDNIEYIGLNLKIMIPLEIN